MAEWGRRIVRESTPEGIKRDEDEGEVDDQLTTHYASKSIMQTEKPSPVMPLDETANFLYMKRIALHETEPGFQIFHDIPADAPDQRLTNVVWESGGDEHVSDIRGREADFSLVREGFTIVRHPTKVRDWENDDIINSIYLPELHELMRREVEDADRIVFFDWAVSNIHGEYITALRLIPAARNRNAMQPQAARQLCSLRSILTLVSPIPLLLYSRHQIIETNIRRTLDQSPPAVIQQVRRQFGDQADKILSGRVRVIKWELHFNAKVTTLLLIAWFW